MASSVLAVVVDCVDVQRVARFWALALDRDVVAREPDELRVGDPATDSPVLYFMAVPEPKSVKNRLHLDIVTADRLEDEIARLESLGARVLDVRQDPPEQQNPDRWAVMADPEGNEFCVTSRRELPGWFA